MCGVYYLYYARPRARSRGNGRTGNGPPSPPQNEPFARKYRWQKFNCLSFSLCHAVPIKSHVPGKSYKSYDIIRLLPSDGFREGRRGGHALTSEFQKQLKMRLRLVVK